MSAHNARVCDCLLLLAPLVRRLWRKPVLVWPTKPARAELELCKLVEELRTPCCARDWSVRAYRAWEVACVRAEHAFAAAEAAPCMMRAVLLAACAAAQMPLTRDEVAQAWEAARAMPQQKAPANAFEINRHEWSHGRNHDMNPNRPCMTEACLDVALTKIRKCWAPFAQRPVNRRPDLSRRPLVEGAVEIHAALNEDDVRAFIALADCTARWGPDRKAEERPFHDHSGASLVWGLGWYLQRIAPELTERIYEIASYASDQDLSSLPIRSAERIVYSQQGHMDLHRDLHSSFTLILLLSRPHEDFDGGHFMLGGHVDLELPLFGGVLVDSSKPHGVAHVSRGRRDVVVVEFWAHHAPNASDWRPEPEFAVPGGVKDEL